MATVRVRLQERKYGFLFHVPMLYFQLGYDKLGLKLIFVLKCIGNLAVFPTCDCLGCFIPCGMHVVLAGEVIKRKWQRVLKVILGFAER